MKLIFVNRDTPEEFNSETYKQPIHLVKNKQTNQIGAKDLNERFPKEDKEMAMKDMKRCSPA